MSDDEELEQEEYKDFKENAQLKAIIAGSRSKSIFIRLNDVEIRVRGAIPKGLRERMIKAGRLWQSGSITDDTDDEIYEIVAQLCIDDPYTTPALWKYIDAETGEVPNVLRMMVEKIVGVEDTAKRFR